MRRRVLLGAGVALLAAPARAQGLPAGFPSRPLTLVAPFTPGGPIDVLARVLGNGFQARGSAAATVDNRTGGGGTIGIDLVRRAAPDGTTMLVIPAGNLTISPTITRNLPYDVERDFAPVSMMATTSNVIVAAAGSPIRSVQDLVAAARARPDSISYGSSGVGSQLHLQMELLRSKAGIEILHVPYRGTTQALTDLLGGRIQLLSSNLPVILPGVREGRLQAVAVTTARRVAELPDVPTLMEAGFDIDVTSWYGLLVPRATPAPVVRAIAEATEAVLRDPATARSLAAQGLDIVAEPPEVFAARIRRETALWAEVIRARGITAE
ncbi:Bug family tripartite tricarboxylate transporter substrate binding protein [Falsiroseomonas oryziterrae]|uniref:Bug family tripartite tricarboxylate transporter substrate binding protein n=1 Tax=Falsiroseomonas oryziterrae TaxID=2911368 RepID=UPI001F173DA3|nr:tripartite tricarboxylate transporter substrate-binding protein [Roseomonas sp. NPKOSM-4]